MKSLIYPVLLLSILLASTACEEVIELEVSNGDPVMVIEGSITNQALAPAQVKLSMSGSYFEPGEYPAVEGAEVVLVSSSGERSTLVEESAGIYRAANLVGEVGEAYTLEIESEGASIRTQSVLEELVPLDSVSFVRRSGGPIEGIFPQVFFQDPAGEATYLRFVVWVNGIPLPSIQLYSDNFTDGAEAFAALTVFGIESGDELMIQAFSLDRAGYDYYNTLSNIVGDAFNPGGQSAAPGNPTSNIEGNAVGYFGAHAVSTISVRVP